MLVALLVLKIAVSLVFLVVPFLFFPARKLAGISGVHAESALFFRLYGWAIVALLVVYGWGLWEALAGRFPTVTVLMGIVSNGSATVVLLLSGASRRRVLPIAIFGGIAVGLAVCLARYLVFFSF